MFFYFLFFMALGGGIGFFIKDKSSAIGAIIAVSIAWALIFGPWAILTFVELCLGYHIVNQYKLKIISQNEYESYEEQRKDEKRQEVKEQEIDEYVESIVQEACKIVEETEKKNKSV